MKVPKGLVETGLSGPTGCTLHVIGPARCMRSWRGWVVGSSTTANEHLVFVGSPIPLRNDAKVVNGPAWYHRARVKPLGWVMINRWRMRVIFIPPAWNDGSAFARHVVLVWTVGEHTYGVGFHDVTGIPQTLRRDDELAKSIELVAP
jgi:hypothetical protein